MRPHAATAAADAVAARVQDSYETSICETTPRFYRM